MRLLFPFLVFAFLLFPLPGRSFSEENRIVAVVNDDVITQTELNRALAPVYLQMQATLEPEEISRRMEQARKEILQQLVEERLMLQEARAPRQVEVGKGKIGTPPVIGASEREVEEMTEQIRGRFQTPEEFSEALRQQGLTLDDLKARFRDQIVIQKLVSREVRSRVTASPAEVTAYYQAHQEEFNHPSAVQVSTILIRPKNEMDLERARAEAVELRQQLLGGADFNEMARRRSDGFNAQMGGQLGFLEKGKGRKEIEEVLFTLKPGEISPVIPTPAGFHIFRVEAIRPPHQASLEEVQEEVKYKIYGQKGEVRYREWIAKLRADSYISVKGQ